MKKVLQVADRMGWAVDRLAKPLSEIYYNVDMCYISVSENRYLDSGYSSKEGNRKYNVDLGNLYDIVHFHRLDAAIHRLSELKARKILHIHTERNDTIKDKNIGLFDDIICPTKYCERKVKETLKLAGLSANVHYIPHGIPLSRYIPIRRNKCEIGYVGRIIEHKRYPYIQKACYDAGYRLIGCGYVDEGDLRNVYNIPENAYEYHSFLEEHLMPGFYDRMKIFICLSRPHIEVGPLPVMEAMANGIPVISTRVGWAVDNCEHGKNIIFIEEHQAEDIDVLTEIIKSAYNDNEYLKNIRDNALKLIKDFDIKKYAENVMKVYEL